MKFFEQVGMATRIMYIQTTDLVKTNMNKKQFGLWSISSK